MRTIRKKLSEEQVKKGIIFTSTLSKGRNEMVGDITHEVYKTDEDKYRKIDRLEDSSFFKNRYKIDRLEDSSFFKNSPWSYNIIRTKQ